MSDSWLVGERTAVATDRILTAAAHCFEAKGVAGTSIEDIARQAGCSRPTIYRYFADRDALRTAFVHREARRVGAQVQSALAHENDPSRRVTVGILAAVKAVRDDATLSVWFAGGDAGTASQIAGSSGVIEAMTASLLGEDPRGTRDLSTRWVVRVILSLLAMPGSDEAEERTMIERFVVPVVVGVGLPGVP
jgi:AcrR family transcriptional regulator